MTTLHDALLERRAIAEQYSQYPDDSVPVEAAMSVLLLDVAMAAERRREAREAFKHRDHESPDKYMIEVTLVGELALAQDIEDDALARLEAHLCGGEDGA